MIRQSAGRVSSAYHFDAWDDRRPVRVHGRASQPFGEPGTGGPRNNPPEPEPEPEPDKQEADDGGHKQ